MGLKIKPPTLSDYQKKILSSKARFTITEASTKSGKTFSHLWWLFKKFCRPPKSGANYWWVAPVYSQAKIAFTRLKNMIGQSGQFKINESELYIQNLKGATIWFKSAEKPDNLYGEDVFAAVFDEFTRGREEAWTALRTTLTATKGQCKFIGNARGKKNWGYRLGLKARQGMQGYEYFKITAHDAIRAGILEEAEIQQAKIDLPEQAFRELYLAEALDDQANPFGIKFINQQEKPLSDNEPICFGIDLAKGKHKDGDWTVVIALDENGDICLFDRWQSDWNQTRRRIIEMVGDKAASIDSTGVGDPIVEDIQKECRNAEGYLFTSPSKQKLMEGLALALQNAYISVLSGPVKEELESFEFEYGRTGVKYSAPEGLHDDCVCALALAYHAFSSGVVSSAPMNFNVFA